MIRLPCYEPAGRVLELSPDDLTRHVIAFGSTGSGKTTALINPVLRQLLAWRANEPGLRPGLLVLDPKGDDSAAKVREFAREVGRESDLVVLSAGGNAWFDLLGGLERLDQIDFYASRLLAGTRDLGKENAYWTDSRDGLVHTALTLMLANGRPVRFAEVVSFMQAWWFTPDSRQMDPVVGFVKQLLCEGVLRPLSQRRLELALAEVKNWRDLDPRTNFAERTRSSGREKPTKSVSLLWTATISSVAPVRGRSKSRSSWSLGKSTHSRLRHWTMEPGFTSTQSVHPSVDAGARDNGLGITKLHQKNRNAKKLNAFACLLAQQGQTSFTPQPMAMKTICTCAGDGNKGWPEAAPFDAIIITCQLQRAEVRGETCRKASGTVAVRSQQESHCT